MNRSPLASFFSLTRPDGSYDRATLALLFSAVALAVIAAAIYIVGMREESIRTRVFTEEEKVNFLDELRDNSPSPLPAREQEKIVDEMSARSGAKGYYEYSDEGKLQILKQLEQQSSSQ